LREQTIELPLNLAQPLKDQLAIPFFARVMNASDKLAIFDLGTNRYAAVVPPNFTLRHLVLPHQTVVARNNFNGDIFSTFAHAKGEGEAEAK
jgi:hypothetical protein